METSPCPATPEFYDPDTPERPAFRPVTPLEAKFHAEVQAKMDCSPQKYLPTELPALQAIQRKVKRAADGAILQSFCIRPGKKPRVGAPGVPMSVIEPLEPVIKAPKSTPEVRPIVLNKKLFEAIPFIDLTQDDDPKTDHERIFDKIQKQWWARLKAEAPQLFAGPVRGASSLSDAPKRAVSMFVLNTTTEAAMGSA